MDELKVLQINVDRSRAAMDLEIATAQVEAGVAIVSEQNKRMAASMGFHLDAKGDVGLRIFGGTEPPNDVLRGDRFIVGTWTWGRVAGVYLSPNTRLETYEEEASNIINALDTGNPGLTRVILVGDLNAKSTLWDRPSRIEGRDFGSSYAGRRI